MSYKDAHAIHKIRRADYDALRASIPEEWERAIGQGRESLWLEGDVLSNASGDSVARILNPPTHLLPGTAEVLAWQGARHGLA